MKYVIETGSLIPITYDNLMLVLGTLYNYSDYFSFSC